MSFTPMIDAHTEDNQSDQAGNKEIVAKKTTTTPGDSVYLYHPAMTQSNSNIEWNAADVGMLGNVADVINSETPAQEIRNKFHQLKGIDYAAALFGGVVKDEFYRQRGHIPNPHRQMFFKGIGFREFKFEFEFIPESESEAKSARDIILHFKKYALPSMGSMFINYPPTWKIKSQVKGKELMMFKPSVITSVNTDASPQSVLSTFQNGFPVSVKLELSFKETDFVTQGDYKAGNIPLGSLGY